MANKSDHKDPLTFLVWFSQQDVSRFRVRQWSALAADLDRFLRAQLPAHPDLVFKPATEFQPTNESTRDIQRLQFDLQALMRPLARRQSVIPPHSPIAQACAQHDHAESTLSMHLADVFVGFDENPCAFACQMSAGWGELTILKAVMQLPDIGADVRECPECQTLFVRIRRQRYCSRPCVNKANMRAWLRTPKGKRRHAHARRHSQRRYVERMHQQYGAKIKIGRQARNGRTA